LSAAGVDEKLDPKKVLEDSRRLLQALCSR
jgi:hypothetical protein